MRNVLNLFGLVLLAVCSCNPPNEFLLGGIHVDEPDYEHYISSLKEKGFNTVEITVYAKQGDWDSDNIWFESVDSAVIRQLQTAQRLNMSSVLILRVALDHAFERNKFLWHGMIMPSNDSLINSWFDKYGAFADYWAVQAQKYDVETLVIGSELKELVATEEIAEDSLLNLEFHHFYDWQDKRNRLLSNYQDSLKRRHLWVRGDSNFSSLDEFLVEKSARNKRWAETIYFRDVKSPVKNVNDRRRLIDTHWRSLISQTRGVFEGRLTYAANFDNYKRVAFWDDLDDVGINAYFRLRSPEIIDSVTIEEEMRENWSRVFSDLDTFSMNNKLKKSILFTELGYTYKDKCTMAPWAHDEFSVIEHGDTNSLVIWYEQKENYRERSLALRALRTCLKERSGDGVELRGLLYWKLSTFAEHKKFEDFLLFVGPESRDLSIAELVGIKNDYYERRN